MTKRLGDAERPGQGLFSNLIRKGHERFEFVAVTSGINPELRPLVEWQRAPIPQSAPLRVQWAVFYATAALALRRVEVDVVHTASSQPAVPNRVDLATVNWCLGGYHEAANGRPPGESRLTWRLARAITLGVERFNYRPQRTRCAEVETPAAKATVERLYPGMRVVHIPLVYDTERLRPDPEVRRAVRAELGAGPDDVVALYMGRNPHIKGLDLAVQGLADARRRGAGNLTLWAGGTGDPMAAARRSGVADRVKALGYLEDVERYLTAADMFLLPTIYEHGSRSSHEAAGCGLPLVVTATSGPAALIGDNEGGIVIGRDPSSIGAALARLAADPELRARMGATARERMLARNGHSHEAFFELYEQLAANGR